MPKIVITNSHSDNRGDEAAQRAMISGLETLVPDAQITVLTVSPEGLNLQRGVKVVGTFSASTRRWLPLLVWATIRSLGIRLPTLGKAALLAIDAMADADAVISAPGGPYFGDLYPSHEINEHLFHLLLCRFMRKPVLIYGPSMGPFKRKKRNILRRYLLNHVKAITLRDPISKEYLEDLKLCQPLVYVTADSAFQDTVSPRDDVVKQALAEAGIVTASNRGGADRPLVGVTPAGAAWNYRGLANFQELEETYKHVMAKMVDYLAMTFDATVLFFPQLYGRSDDLPLINDIVARVTRKDAAYVLSKKWDSQIQQAVISGMDLVIGNRYHSVIFALKGCVPTVCLAYEHKSVGIMNAIGLQDHVIRIADLDFDLLVRKIDQAWSHRQEITASLRSELPRIVELARINSLIAAAFIRCAMQSDLRKETLRREILRLADQWGVDPNLPPGSSNG